MNRIDSKFQELKAAKKKGLVIFITAGAPDIETTIAAVKMAEANGADAIELGIPFSDPTAEGPVIQGANEVALKNGATTDKVFDLVKRLREKTDVPFCFMTYANVIFSYGSERFMSRCKELGVDGIILPDIPFEEKGEFDDIAKQYDVDMVSLIAPTSEDRITMIAKDATGFIYVVSSLGVTGVRSEITTDIGAMVKLVKEAKDIPCAIGFGISNPETAKKMAAVSDGVIVGSAIVKIIAQYGEEAPKYVGEFVKSITDSIK